MKGLAIFAAVFLFVAACSQAPHRASYPLSYQQKMQASEHWNSLARGVAEEVKWVIRHPPECPIGSTASNFGHASPDIQKATQGSTEAENMLSQVKRKGIFISDADQSPFGKAMRTMLITEIMNERYTDTGAIKNDRSGFDITLDENSPFKLTWEVQPVYHQANRKNDTGLLAFYALDIPQAIIFGETDWPFHREPHSEVIITFKFLKNECNLIRNTKVFYVNEADRNHYWNISQQDTPKSGLKTVMYNVTKN
jgi:hypothetical protein